MKSFRKWNRRLTPSGYLDNGIYYLSDEKVSFPNDLLKKAIVEDVKVKVGSRGLGSNCPDKKEAIKITVDGKSWIVSKEDWNKGRA